MPHIKSFCVRGLSFATFSEANFSNSELCSLNEPVYKLQI